MSFTDMIFGKQCNGCGVRSNKVSPRKIEGITVNLCFQCRRYAPKRQNVRTANK